MHDVVHVLLVAQQQTVFEPYRLLVAGSLRNRALFGERSIIHGGEIAMRTLDWAAMRVEFVV